MVRLVARYLALVVAVVVLNFLLPRLLPGDPFEVGSLTQAARDQLRVQYGIDQPMGEQFLRYLGGVATGDLGRSISRPGPVTGLIVERLPWTLALVGTAVLVAAALGTMLGLVAGWRGGRMDRALVTVVSALVAIPEFLVAMGLLLVFAVGIGWFPLTGGRSVFGAPGGLAALVDLVRHLTLPALALVLTTSAGFLLLARGLGRDVVGRPFVTAARAKGLGERALAVGHGLPNIAWPLVTLFGLRVGQVLGGAIVVERVFGLPGLGLLAYEAVRARDYPVIQGIFLITSFGVLAVTFLIDAARQTLDPQYGA